jgi:hypothetical protein
MNKYRIVQKGKRYYPQFRIFGFIWIECDINQWYSDLDEAKQYLDTITKKTEVNKIKKIHDYP